MTSQNNETPQKYNTQFSAKLKSPRSKNPAYDVKGVLAWIIFIGRMSDAIDWPWLYVSISFYSQFYFTSFSSHP
jgi:hypothetical protein